jgi:hypothetical protein
VTRRHRRKPSYTCAVSIATTTDARHALLDGLIDHAALFPPASMSVPDALAEDARVRAGDDAWIVGRFVVPASRVRELGDAPLHLSVVLDGPLLDDGRVEAVELRRPGTLAGLRDLASEVYVEVPADRLDELPRLAALGLRAKFRCGGEVVPPVPALGAAVRRCRELGIAFKATAGLHHAVRTRDGHGFLNLLAATVFGDEERALADGDPGAFSLRADSFAWRGRAAGPDELARVRRELFAGFGSCSVQEPVDDLRALGLLPL